MFRKGERVRDKHDPSVMGAVTGGTREVNGRIYLEIELPSGKRDHVLATRLEAVMGNPDAFADLAAGRLSAASDLRRLLTHVRLTGQLSDVFYSMEASDTEFHAYQFKPVVKILNSAAKGVLIADEVGLGKTIEAGLVWLELMARYNASRLLVVCPKSLQDKWKLELLRRFSVHARIVDAGQLLESLQDAQRLQSDCALITSYSAVRAPKDWDKEDDSPNADRTRLARFMNEAEGGEPLIDLVVFDEAHHLRNSQTAQHKTSRQVVGIADHKLMLSATPINLRSEDLRSILRLIDPDLFDRDWIFEEMQEENGPIVAAREAALSSTTTAAALSQTLDAIGSGGLLKNDRRLSLLREQLNRRGAELSPSRRAEIAQRLEDMSMLGGIVNRTRRRDVVEIQIKRRAACRRWSMNSAERVFYEEATEAIRQYAFENDISDAFLLSNTQRVLASCLPAAWTRWSTRNDLLDDEGEGDDAQEVTVGPLVSALSRVCQDVERLGVLRAGDSKYALLKRGLEETWKARPEEKIIVFSSFRGTLDYLQERLTTDGVRIRKLHGQIKENRSEVLDNFRRDAGPAVLLASEIGSEGLDLQFCRIVVNYDLPWNPMRVEQRIGRIDRIGQVAPSVEIFSLICEGTIEDAIYRKLYERLDLIERTIGGFEPILGDLLHELENRLLDPSLSREDVEREVERAAVSAETRKLQIEELEAEAPGLIAHGDAILRRIQSSHDNQGWISPDELYAYTRDVLQALFPNAQLDRAPTTDATYDLKLGAAAHHAFTDFLRRDARNYPTSLRRSDRARVVFGRTDGDGKPAERLHPGHPFIRFLGRAMASGGDAMKMRPSIWGRIDPETLDQPITRGEYGIVVQRWTTQGLQKEDKLVFSGMNLRTGDKLDPVLSEALILSCLEKLRQQSPQPGQCEAIATVLKLGIVDAILSPAHDDHLRASEAAHQDRCDTRRAIVQRKLEEHRRKSGERIEKLRQGGERSARLIPAETGKLHRFEARMQAQLEQLQIQSDFRFEDPETLGVVVLEVG